METEREGAGLLQDSSLVEWLWEVWREEPEMIGLFLQTENKTEGGVISMHEPDKICS